MAKKIKFPLEMLNGVQVRTIEQLRDNFDFEKILNYFIEGKLQIWLRDRHYENEAKQIEELNKNESFNMLKSKICKIFGAEYHDVDEFDIGEIERRNKRINLLRQYTDSEDIIEKIDNVVFNQEELTDILDRNINIIYICKGKYTIALSKMNMTYIGIGNPIIIVDSKEDIDFDSKYIRLENVTLRLENAVNITAKNSKGIKYDGKLKSMKKVEKKKYIYVSEKDFYIGISTASVFSSDLKRIVSVYREYLDIIKDKFGFLVDNIKEYILIDLSKYIDIKEVVNVIFKDSDIMAVNEEKIEQIELDSNTLKQIINLSKRKDEESLSFIEKYFSNYQFASLFKNSAALFKEFIIKSLKNSFDDIEILKWLDYVNDQKYVTKGFHFLKDNLDELENITRLNLYKEINLAREKEKEFINKIYKSSIRNK